MSLYKNSNPSEEFILGKCKSGGYYTFSSKDVKRYLDFKLGKDTRRD